MYRNLLILPDGSRIFSGSGEDPVIQKLSLTQKINADTQLIFGTVCSQLLEATLWATAGVYELKAGDRLQLYEVEQEARFVGEFILEEIRKKGSVYKLNAYDPICLLDRDLTDFIGSLQNWPYSLLDLTKLVLDACGLELAGEQIPNGELSVAKFIPRGVTGRQLIGWAAQAAGCFCRATAEGKVEFAWYTPTDVVLSPTGDEFYYSGSLNCADYRVKPITGIQLRQSEQDVGTVWPETGSGENPYILQGNPFLIATDATALKWVAENLFQRLSGIVYTPCQLTAPSDLQILPGQILFVNTDKGQICMYVMERKRSGGKDTLSCTGSYDRGSAAARNQASFQALSGKILQLQTDVDGIRAQNADAEDNFTRMELDLQGIRTQVNSRTEGETAIKQQLSQLELDSQGLSLRLQNVMENGVSKVVTSTGYQFTEAGLSIKKDGQEMENLLDHTGMYVRRSGQTILQANNQGVAARDVTVENFLVIGENTRFEDYSNGTDRNRTACFYIGGAYGAAR